jgi:hypothetical protein
MRALETRTNSKGKTYALAANGNSYGVWAKCINYKLGRDLTSWRYVQINMTLDEAKALFARRTK